MNIFIFPQIELLKIFSEMSDKVVKDKPPKGQAEECYVLDEYIVEDTRNDERQERKDGKGKNEDKKRGQNKKRPVFKVNNKVSKWKGLGVGGRFHTTKNLF